MEGEPPVVTNGGKIVRARKNWCCQDCGTLIPKKTRYFAESGLWDGRWDTQRLCMVCYDLRLSTPHAHMSEVAYGCLYEFVVGYMEDRERERRWLARYNAVAEWDQFKR